MKTKKYNNSKKEVNKTKIYKANVIIALTHHRR